MNHEQQDRPIDLGAASVETKGSVAGFPDQERTLQPVLGLADD